VPTLNFNDKDAHWYSREGAPAHDSDLRSARKLGLLPSVTSVLGVWPKYQLENFKQESAVLAAITLPRRTNESEDEFAQRVVIDAKAQVKAAAEFGRRIHGACEAINLGRFDNPLLSDKAIAPFSDYYREWFMKNVVRIYSTEQVAVNNLLGYAGTYDLFAEVKDLGSCLLDIKTQKTRQKPMFYDTWEMQLAAYKETISPSGSNGVKIDNTISLIIPSTTPAMPVAKVWNPDHGHAFECFHACLHLWRLNKKFPFERR
jgi:hypothetical protein